MAMKKTVYLQRKVFPLVNKLLVTFLAVLSSKIYFEYLHLLRT